MKKNIDDLKRIHNFCIKLNSKELEVFNKYCKKYNITNKSQFIRETLMKTIFEKMVELDYPNLFAYNLKDNNVNKDDKNNSKANNVIKNISHPKLFKK